jgi:hypothetical protein
MTADEIRAQVINDGWMNRIPANESLFNKALIETLVEIAAQLSELNDLMGRVPQHRMFTCLSHRIDHGGTYPDCAENRPSRELEELA